MSDIEDRVLKTQVEWTIAAAKQLGFRVTPTVKAAVLAHMEAIVHPFSLIRIHGRDWQEVLDVFDALVRCDRKQDNIDWRKSSSMQISKSRGAMCVIEYRNGSGIELMWRKS